MEVKEQTLIDESTSSTQKRRKKNTVRCWYGCVLLILYTLGWRGLTDIDDAATSSQHFEIYLLSWVGALKNLWFNLLIQVLGLKMFCLLSWGLWLHPFNIAFNPFLSNLWWFYTTYIDGFKVLYCFQSTCCDHNKSCPSKLLAVNRFSFLSLFLFVCVC